MVFEMTQMILICIISTVWLIIGCLSLLYETTTFEDEMHLFESIFIVVCWPLFWFLRTIIKIRSGW